MKDYSEKYTIDYYCARHGGWELVQGEVYAMLPLSLYIHQHINGKTFRQLDKQSDNCLN